MMTRHRRPDGGLCDYLGSTVCLQCGWTAPTVPSTRVSALTWAVGAVLFGAGALLGFAAGVAL